MNVSSSFDVLVVGGGPAGCAAASTLAGSLSRIAMIDRGNGGSSPRIELLPPNVTPLLHRLGVWEQFLKCGPTGSPGIVSLWGTLHARETSFLSSPYRMGWHVVRPRLDAMLLDTTEQRGVTVFRQSRLVRLKARNAGWEAVVATRDIRVTISASFLVDATGSRSSISRHFGTRRRTIDRLIGIAGVCCGSAAPYDPRLLIEAVEHGWWYLSPAPGLDVMAVFMTDLDVLRSEGQPFSSLWWREMKRTRLIRTHVTGDRLLDLKVFPADSFIMDRVSGAQWITVGDAATTCDPLSSNGIISALETGIAAAERIVSSRLGGGLQSAAYDDGITHRFEHFLKGHAYFYGAVAQWPHSRFWTNRAIRREVIAGQHGSSWHEV